MTACTTLLPSKHTEERRNKCSDIPACAILTTSEWDASRTFTLLMLMIMSPTSSPDVSAGVSGSIADTTTGLEPCIRNPNSPDWRLTTTVLSHSATPRTCNPYSTQQHQKNNSTGSFLRSYQVLRQSRNTPHLSNRTVPGWRSRYSDLVRGSSTGGSEIFHTSPDRRFYTTRNGSLPWVQSGRGVLLATHLHLAPRLKKV